MTQPTPTPHIRPLADHDSIEDLTILLHRAYRVLAAMNLRYLATHQSPDTTRERIAHGRCFVAELDSAVVGTIVYVPPDHQSGSPWLSRPDVAHFEQLGVDPAYQNRGIAGMLIERAETEARHDGATELALDTAEPATHLIEWYERLGYRFIEHVDWNVTNYRSVVMSKRLVES